VNTKTRTELMGERAEEGAGTSGAGTSGAGTSGIGTNAEITALSGDHGRTRGRPGACRGVTRDGKPCRRRPRGDGFCHQHAMGDGQGARHAGERAAEVAPEEFYARVLSAAEQTLYARALAQQGLAAEVAVLRLHLLRLIERDDPDRPAEIPRTVHALVRALNDPRRTSTTADDEGAETLDAAIREEGRRLLSGDDTAMSQGQIMTESAAPASALPIEERKRGGRAREVDERGIRKTRKGLEVDE